MAGITDTYTNYAQLPFEERQKVWRGEGRQFRQHHGRGERPTVWEISVDGDRVYTRFGLVGGATQQTNYVGKAKNVGRSNEISAELDALAEARRDVRKKWDFEGYDEYVREPGKTQYAHGAEYFESWLNIDRRHENISVQHLLTNLPSSFCLYKPLNNLLDHKGLLEKTKNGETLYTYKRDGVALWIVVDYYGNVQIYSRRSRAWEDHEGPKELPDGTLDYSTVVPWTARFPHLVEAVRALKLPHGTMMAAELVARDKEDFRYISGLTKGYTQRALEDMAQHGYPMLYWWDVPFYDGKDLVSTTKVIDRYQLITEHWSKNTHIKSVMNNIQPIQYSRGGEFASPEAAIEYVKSIGMEGYVVVDPQAIYGDKGWNLKGKPDRPSSIAKLKPAFEDDFVVLWDPSRKDGPKKNAYGEWGTGKHEAKKKVTLPDGSSVIHGGVGSVGLWQYNPKGELVFICKCATGMDYAFQANLKMSDFPTVWEIRYTERTYISDGEDTNALKFPRVLRARPDKRPVECVNDRL